MMFNATFNNISVISRRSVLLVNETQSTQRNPQTYHKSLTNLITSGCIEYTSPWVRFELTSLEVICTDSTVVNSPHPYFRKSSMCFKIYKCLKFTLSITYYILSSVKIGHHFGMHCHVNSDVDDVIYPENCVQK